MAKRAKRQRTTPWAMETPPPMPGESSDSSSMPILLALGAAGLAYLVMTQSEPSDTDRGVSSVPLPTVDPTPADVLPGGPNGTQAAPLRRTVDRIMNDDRFRQVYAVQSLGYSTRLTDDAPDGLMGPKTMRLLEALRGAVAGQGPIPDIDERVVRLMSMTAFARNAQRIAALRLQPTWLPEDAVLRLNRLTIGYVPGTSQQLAPIQTRYAPA